MSHTMTKEMIEKMPKPIVYKENEKVVVTGVLPPGRFFGTIVEEIADNLQNRIIQKEVKVKLDDFDYYNMIPHYHTTLLHQVRKIIIPGIEIWKKVCLHKD